MADSKAMSGAGATPESQDSQKTIEYSLENANETSPPGQSAGLDVGEKDNNKTLDNTEESISCPGENGDQEEEMEVGVMDEVQNEEEMEQEESITDINSEEDRTIEAQSLVSEATGNVQTERDGYGSVGPTADCSNSQNQTQTTETEQVNKAVGEGDITNEGDITYEGEDKSDCEPICENTDTSASEQNEKEKSNTQKSSHLNDKTGQVQEQQGELTGKKEGEDMECDDSGNKTESVAASDTGRSEHIPKEKNLSEFPDPPLESSECKENRRMTDKTVVQSSSDAATDKLKCPPGENRPSVPEHAPKQESKKAREGSKMEHKKDGQSSSSSEGMGGSKLSTGKTGKKCYSDSSDDDDDWERPWASRDTMIYRQGYPGRRDNPRLDLNYKFYTNKLYSEPNGDYIDSIHEKWKGDYDLLEMHHGYIQWLFPIRESGMNWHAQELQGHEIEKICADADAHRRVLTSYEMMLDFYGMRLKNRDTGELERAQNWQSRFLHLNRSMHNYLRITRILKCLGEFKYEHLKAPFVRFVLEEAIDKGTLRNTKTSCLNYWLEVIKDDEERKKIKKYAKKLTKNKNPKRP